MLNVVSRMVSLLLILIGTLSTSFAAEKMTREQISAAYIYRLSEKISWPEGSVSGSFKVHLVGANRALSSSLDAVVSATTLHGSTIEVTRSDTADLPASVNVVFIAEGKKSLVNKIVSGLGSRSVLIISENLDNDRIAMIDLYQNEGNQVLFKINKANILSRGLSVDPDIIVLGGSEIDVARVYRASQLDLRALETKFTELEQQNIILARKIGTSEKVVAELERTIASQRETLNSSQQQLQQTQQKIVSQKQILDQQILTIDKQKNQIDQDTETLRRYQFELDKQREHIAAQQNRYQLLVRESAEQKQVLDTRSKELQKQAEEISRREQILDSLEVKIGSLDRRIAAQESQIATQRSTLASQSEQLERQALTLYLMASILILIIILALIIYLSRKRYRDLSEQLRIAKDDADYANRSKSVFLANMSHELRTPLNSVLGFSDLLLKRTQDDEQREVLSIINRSGDHLLNLINDVLDLSKIEAGKITAQSGSFDLIVLVTDLCQLMEDRAKSKSLCLDLQYSDSLPRYINSDSVKIRQILLNLISNAVKYSDRGEVTVIVDYDSEFIYLRVTDTGPGISEPDLEQIFEPFVQLQNASGQSGTGLGLAITKQFVELLGGELSVESTQGMGSSFTASVRYSVAGKVDVEEVETVPIEREVIGLNPSQQGLKVLLVDDQPDNMRLLKNIVDVLGLQVKQARNGEEAVSEFKAWQPDFIWMDRRMPKMSGEEATEAIRELPGGDSVSIVALTASAFVEDKNAIMSSGMDDFVAKPYSTSHIYSCMQKHLGLEFIYSDDDQPANDKKDYSAEKLAEELSQLETEVLQEMYNAALLLDAEAMEPVLQRIEKSKPKLVKQLSKIMSDFNFHFILNALEQVFEIRGIEEHELG